MNKEDILRMTIVNIDNEIEYITRNGTEKVFTKNGIKAYRLTEEAERSINSLKELKEFYKSKL